VTAAIISSHVDSLESCCRILFYLVSSAQWLTCTRGTSMNTGVY